MSAQHIRDAPLPAGTVTLLFSDIEGSTRLLERLGARYAELLASHHAIVRAAIAAHGGHEVRTAGDGFFVAFARADDAVAAAIAIQRDLAARTWPDRSAVRVRIGLHSGEPTRTGDDYLGLDVHCAARICAAAHGGQVVLSEATRLLLGAGAIVAVPLRDLGVHRLRDLSRPVRLHQVAGSVFPPLRTLGTEGPDRGQRGARTRTVVRLTTAGPPPARTLVRTAIVSARRFRTSAAPLRLNRTTSRALPPGAIRRVSEPTRTAEAAAAARAVPVGAVSVTDARQVAPPAGHAAVTPVSTSRVRPEVSRRPPAIASDGAASEAA
jgi:class 3 adenylate cyclase